MEKAAAVAAVEEVARKAAVQVAQAGVDATRAGCVSAKAKYTESIRSLRPVEAGFIIHTKAMDHCCVVLERLSKKRNMSRDDELVGFQADYDLIQTSQRKLADDLPKVEAAMIAALSAKDAAHAQWSEAERDKSATALALRRLMLSHAPLH